MKNGDILVSTKAEEISGKLHILLTYSNIFYRYIFPLFPL